MQTRITAREVLQLSDIGDEALKSMRRRDQIAIAFGGHDIVAAKMYLPVDGVALMISSALSETYGASTAAALTRASADKVLIAVAQAGVSNATVPLAIIDLVRGDGRRAYVASAAAVEPSAADGYVLERVTSINVSHIIDQVRARAARIDLDLSAPFLPAPDSVEFAEIMAPYAELEAGIVEARSIRKRDAAAQRVGARSRVIAMGGASHRSARSRVTEVTAAI